MPPRPFVLAIVLFWLATTGWLFRRDLWPKLRPGQPPPFTIDLSTEAQRQPAAYWTIYRNETKIGVAETVTRYNERDDTFSFHGRIQRLDLGIMQMHAMSGVYRVTREGRLRDVSVQLSVKLLAFPLQMSFRLEGEVRNDQFYATVELDAPQLGKVELELDPVPVAANGSILNPLHPVNRIVGLRPGQHWRMPLVDPLRDALAAAVEKTLGKSLAGSFGVRYLDAEVLAKTEPVRWEGSDWPCLVIEYTGDDGTLARTWVRESDGLVLRQLATLPGERLVLQRDDPSAAISIPAAQGNTTAPAPGVRRGPPVDTVPVP
jgi:hypothetical protein